ncbi:MAG: sulfotransferase domain-containing protein [Pseudolabrys sp.]|nr:sulfotransferase domain-containing protein [Pseudolabrys sp.]
MMHTIWLASFPKSGNTWLRMLIANLSASGDKPADINDLPERNGIASAREPFDDITLIDSGLLTHDEIDCLRPRVHEELAQDDADEDDDRLKDLPPVRFVKVHDAYILTPKAEPLLAGARGADGAIVIVRDPRDVAPSLASHNRSSIDQAITFMNNKTAAFCARPTRQHNQLRQRIPGWSEHIASWLDQRDIPIHLIRYEDMQANPTGGLTRALAFAKRDASMEEIARAVRLADFSQLQAQEREKGFCEAPRARPGGQFFRRGIAGAWRDELNREQVARIEAAHAPMMRRLGYALASSPPLACAG